jgi:hypothetical protein
MVRSGPYSALLQHIGECVPFGAGRDQGLSLFNPSAELAGREYQENQRGHCKVFIYSFLG